MSQWTTQDHSLLQVLLKGTNPYKKYINDIPLYAKEVLGISLWEKQAEVARAVVKERRVLVKSANGVGKTLLLAVIADWVYRCFDPSETIITGPRAELLDDTTFKEIRRLHGPDPAFNPRSSRIGDSPTHYIKATTAKDASAFQGIHSPVAAILLEEATGVEAFVWEAARSILIGERSYFVAIFNPTDSSSQAYIEEQSGEWDVHSISAFEHPNIVNELSGKPPVIPGAVCLDALLKNMTTWGNWITRESELDPGDMPITFPGNQTKYWRPGPIAEARILGRYPSHSAYSIFAESDFDEAVSHYDEASEYFENLYNQVQNPRSPNAGQPDRFGKDQVPCFASDIARFGDDRTAITGKIGKYVFLHEWHSGQDTNWTANRLKQLCNEWGDRFGISPIKIPVKIDDTGVGGAVTDNRGEYFFVGINASRSPIEECNYPNARSEMLFSLADQMRRGEVRFAPWIDRQIIAEIKRQAISVTYKPDSLGRRVAESKENVKKRVRRSPDDLDALALACYHLVSGYTEHKTPNIAPRPILREGRNLFGQTQH